MFQYLLTDEVSVSPVTHPSSWNDLTRDSVESIASACSLVSLPVATPISTKVSLNLLDCGIAASGIVVNFSQPVCKPSFKKLFLASDILSIAPPTTLPTSVQSDLACSKSPITVCQVIAQPEPIASLSVSINMVNVLISEAASVALIPSSSKCLICSALIPIPLSSAS